MDETQRMLDALNSGFPDLAALPPFEARAAADARVRPAPNIDDVAETRDVEIDASEGLLRVRAYLPHQPDPAAPVTIYAHGGGFMHGSIASHDAFCRRWAKGTGSTVVSVDYRLAPEHRAPAASDDLVAALDWSVGAGLADRGAVLAGDSAGATAAAIAALELRRRGDSPAVGQVLLYPMLDPAMDSASHRERSTGYFVTARQLRFYWDAYLGVSPERVRRDWRITPLFADDLSGLPRAIIVTAGNDPLSDEGARYGRRLRDAGVGVLHRHYPDQFHGFVTIPDYGPGESARAQLWSDIIREFHEGVNA